MTKKLLNKTTRNYLIFSVLIMVVSAPVFYFIIERLYIDETDETLVFHKEEFFDYYKNRFTENDIANWNNFNRNVKIEPFRNVQKDTLLNKFYFDVLENETEPYRELWSPITINGKLYTYVEKINLIERQDMLMSIAFLFLFVITILLGGVTLISKITSERLWKPFYETLHQIRDFEIDKNKEPKFVSTKIEEFDSLNKSISRLIEKNRAIYNNQKEFVENAAHELQTPLALFQTKIDTLFQFSDLSEAQSRLLTSLNDDVSRLNRLNKNLLLLSKIEQESAVEKQPILLNDYLKKNLDFFSEQAKSKNLTISTAFLESIEVYAHPGFAEVLLNNLFLNAIRHNIPDGKISIRLENNSLQISNTGSAEIQASDKLFNRFSKSNPSSKGNGLGLAIVKKIADLNHWTILYAFSNNQHSFTVTF